MHYAIPEILIEPELVSCQKCLNDVARAIIDCGRHIAGRRSHIDRSCAVRTDDARQQTVRCFFEESAGFDDDTARRLSSAIDTNTSLSDSLVRLQSIDVDVTRVSQSISEYIRTFDFLWRDDSQLQYRLIIEQNDNGDENTIIVDPDAIPPIETRRYLQRELQRLVQVDARLQLLPNEFQIGCICIETMAIVNALRAFVFNWKIQYGTLLHRFAKNELDQVVTYRQQVQVRFNDDVSTLEQLDEALILLEELSEMENKIE
jgi:hypothetical protein